MANIQSILNKIATMANRTGLFSIQKNEFFGLLTDMTNKVKEVNDNVNSVAKSLIWQSPVATFSDLATTYPSAVQGWAAMVTGEGLVYSFNGSLPWKSTGLTAFPADVAVKDMIFDDEYYRFDNILSSTPIYNGYVNSAGVVTGTTDADWFHTNLIRVKPCILNFTSIIGQGTAVNIASFYNKNGDYLSGLTDMGNGGYEIPENSEIWFVRFSGLKNKLTANLAIVSGLFFKEKVNRLDKIELNMATKDILFDDVYLRFDNILSSTPIYNGYVNSAGVVTGTTDADWFHTDLIRVKPCILNFTSLIGQGTAVNIASFYNENGDYLSGLTDMGNGGYEIPENSEIWFVRFSGLKNKLTANLAIISGFFFKEKVNRFDDFSNRLNQNKFPSAKFKYDINHIISYGQSLSQGDWATSIISNNQKYNSLMFTGGIRVWENRNQASIYDALVPAVETFFTYADGGTVVGAYTRGETPCLGISEKINQLIQSENGFDTSKYQFQMLMSAPGMGGMTIEELMDKTGIYYQRLLRDVTNGKRLSNLQGKSYACTGIAWIQGETDCEAGTTEIDYYNMMSAMFESLNADIKSITGQFENVHFFLYQTWCYDFYYTGFHYPDVPLAQLRISLEKENVHMACPIYNLQLLNDNVHLTPISSKILGGSIGLAYKRTILDGIDWNPIHVIDYWLDGNNVYLKFYAPTLPLKFDITNVPDVGIAKGFQFRQVDDRSQNSFFDIITNVELNKPDVIKITCQADPRGKKLTYLINGTATPTNKVGLCTGNLRDSQEISFNFKDNASEETTHYLYNFCPLFEKIIE